MSNLKQYQFNSLENDILKTIFKHYPFSLMDIQDSYFHLKSFNKVINAIKISLSRNQHLCITTKYYDQETFNAEKDRELVELREKVQQTLIKIDKINTIYVSGGALYSKYLVKEAISALRAAVEGKENICFQTKN